jgi:hypothetical protein
MAMGFVGKTLLRRSTQARICRNRLPRMRVALRIASNIGLIAGQCVLLFVSRDAGLGIIICSSLLSLPFFLKEKMWDVTLLIAFMQAVNIVGLFVR